MQSTKLLNQSSVNTSTLNQPVIPMNFRQYIVAITFTVLSLQALGGSLEDGQDLYNKEKYADALAAFKHAADEGNVQAFFILGAMHENGDGVEKNYAQAMTWYMKAAEHGDAAAQSNIGTLYENGQGVTKDFEKATAWYLKAAESGNQQAQSNLGVAYFKGQGVAIDKVEAYKWIFLAESGGNLDAKIKREYLEGFLNDAQKSEAKQRANEWLQAWMKRMNAIKPGQN